MLFELVAMAIFLAISVGCYFMFMRWIEEYGGGKPVPEGLIFIAIVAALSAPVSFVKFIGLIFSLLV